MDVLQTQRWIAGSLWRHGDANEGRSSRPLLNARQIEVISAVARTGSVTEAAGLLGVSQPAVSMMLRECNELVGFPLFERRRGRMLPTHETSLLIPELELIMDGLHRIGRLLGDLRDANTGHVRLLVAPLLADTVLPHALASFHRQRIQLVLDTISADDPLADIEADHADLALVLSIASVRSPGVLNIGETPLVCVLHPDHPLARKTRLAASDLRDTPIIGFGDSLPVGVLLRETFETAGFTPDRVCQVSNSSTALALVEQNIGVAIVPELALKLGGRKPVVRPFTSNLYLAVQLVFPTHRRMSRAARRLSVSLRASARAVLADASARLDA